MDYVIHHELHVDNLSVSSEFRADWLIGIIIAHYNLILGNTIKVSEGDIAQHGRHKCRQVKSIEAVKNTMIIMK